MYQKVEKSEKMYFVYAAHNIGNTKPSRGSRSGEERERKMPPKTMVISHHVCLNMSIRQKFTKAQQRQRALSTDHNTVSPGKTPVTYCAARHGGFSNGVPQILPGFSFFLFSRSTRPSPRISEQFKSEVPTHDPRVGGTARPCESNT